MSNVRFLYNNLAAAATASATASASVSSLPPANVQIPDPSLVWRSTTTTGDQWWRITFGSAQAITAIALKYITLHTGGGTLKVQYSTNGGGAWNDYGTIPAVDADSLTAFLFVASQIAQDWRFYFTNVGASSSYVEIGYAFLGGYLEPTINVQVGSGGSSNLDIALTDRSVVTESLTGQPSTTVRPQQAVGTLTFNDAPDADRTNLQTLFRTVGYGTPFFLVLDTTTAWTAWLIAFRSQMDRTFGEIYNRFGLVFSWVEVL